MITDFVAEVSASRARSRVVSDVLDRVKRDREGKTAATIADELRREFAAAGTPLPPETVLQHAEALAEYLWPGAYHVGKLVDVVVSRRIPPGFRSKNHRLPDGRWATVELAGSAWARSALRRQRRLHGFGDWMNAHVETQGKVDFSALPKVRLIAMPGAGGQERIAVLVSSDFAGTLAPEYTAAILPAFDAAETADAKLTTTTRFLESGILQVAVPL